MSVEDAVDDRAVQEINEIQLDQPPLVICSQYARLQPTATEAFIEPVWVIPRPAIEARGLGTLLLTTVVLDVEGNDVSPGDAPFDYSHMSPPAVQRSSVTRRRAFAA